jgi:2-dehydro-3-deoxyphosphooctonate aldolase (KDO 8-P synthase)
MAESFALIKEVAEELVAMSKRLDFDLVFKSSFDKANRTSIESYRGPGLSTAMQWFHDIKSLYSIPILTDVHETCQVLPVGEICDVLQIPAFLCRQTDLVVAAVQTGRAVNIKKGQFMAPQAMSHIVEKVRATCLESDLPENLMLTERGTTFGYGDLVVDMRSLAVMSGFNVPVIFDITHSTQQPPNAGKGISSALRQHAGLLARSAAATGRIDGFFLEVHPSPKNAKSDADAQLTPQQAESLLTHAIPMLKAGRIAAATDSIFLSTNA